MNMQSYNQKRKENSMMADSLKRNAVCEGKIFLPVLLCFFTVMLCTNCHNNSADECLSSVDCELNSICVNEMCVTGDQKCETLGVFEEVTRTSPQNATSVEQFHVILDNKNAVHYCYSGLNNNGDKVAFYGEQITTEDFVEEPLEIDGVPIVCGGLTIAAGGIPYVLSKYDASILYKNEEAWVQTPLAGMQTKESKSALRSNTTFVSVSNASKGGVYVAISSGYQTVSQPLYIAEIVEKEVNILLNGWDDGNASAFIGYAPQVIEIEDTLNFVAARSLQNDIVLLNDNLEFMSTVIGRNPKVAYKNASLSRIVYQTQNGELMVVEIDETGYAEIANLGEVDLAKQVHGQIPLDAIVDKKGGTHILFEVDNSKGEYGLLVYQRVSPKGKPGASQIVPGSLDTNITGNQRYDVGLDICRRPVIAMITSECAENDDDICILPEIEVFQMN